LVNSWRDLDRVFPLEALRHREFEHADAENLKILSESFPVFVELQREAQSYSNMIHDIAEDPDLTSYERVERYVRIRDEATVRFEEKANELRAGERPRQAAQGEALRRWATVRWRKTR
jgi:hypothetical protein